MKKAFTPILKTCLRSILVAAPGRAYLRRLGGQLIPSNSQKLQVQGVGPPISSSREWPFPRIWGGMKSPPAALQEEQTHLGSPGLRLCGVLRQHTGHRRSWKRTCTLWPGAATRTSPGTGRVEVSSALASPAARRRYGESRARLLNQRQPAAQSR